MSDYPYGNHTTNQHYQNYTAQNGAHYRPVPPPLHQQQQYQQPVYDQHGQPGHFNQPYHSSPQGPIAYPGYSSPGGNNTIGDAYPPYAGQNPSPYPAPAQLVPLHQSPHNPYPVPQAGQYYPSPHTHSHAHVASPLPQAYLSPELAHRFVPTPTPEPTPAYISPNPYPHFSTGPVSTPNYTSSHSPAPIPNSIDPSILRAPSHPPAPSSAAAVADFAHATPAVTVPKIKLRLPRATDQTQDEIDNMPSARSHSAASNSTSARPTRQASLRGQASMQQTIAHLDDEDEEEEDADGEEGDYIAAVKDEDDYDGLRKSGRERKPTQRFGGGDDFEDRLMETSPAEELSPKIGAKKAKKRVVDPDSTDEDGEDPDPEVYIKRPTSRRAFPPRNSITSASAPELFASNGAAGAGAGAVSGGRRASGRIEGTNGRGNGHRHDHDRDDHGRKTRGTRAKSSRHSSADAESFQPSGSEAGSPSDEGSDDPLLASYHEDDFVDDDEEQDMAYGSRARRQVPQRRGRQPPPRQQQRQQQQQSRLPRRSARAAAARLEDLDDNDVYPGTSTPKRNLRERPKVNYALPPADLTAEMTQAELTLAIESASGPRRGGAGAGAGAAGSGAGTGGAGGAAARRRGMGVAGRFAPGKRGFDFSMGGAGSGVRAMGDPDTSDSVS